MKGQLIKICIFLGLLCAVGGVAAAIAGFEIICQTVVAFLPIFKPVIVQSFKDYLTSARFITASILMVLSSFGIYLTAKKKKILFMIVSIILDVIMIASIISNLARCS